MNRDRLRCEELLGQRRVGGQHGIGVRVLCLQQRGQVGVVAIAKSVALVLLSVPFGVRASDCVAVGAVGNGVPSTNALVAVP